MRFKYIKVLTCKILHLRNENCLIYLCQHNRKRGLNKNGIYLARTEQIKTDDDIPMSTTAQYDTSPEDREHISGMDSTNMQENPRNKNHIHANTTVNLCQRKRTNI